MARYFICLFVFCLGVQIYAQESDTMIKEIQRLTLVNDSLGRAYKSLKQKYDSLERVQRSFIITCNESLSDCQMRLANREQDYKNLKDELNLERQGAEPMRALQKERDRLKVEIDTLNDRIVKEKKKEYDSGKKSVINRIEQAYKIDFDSLIVTSSLQDVKSDLLIVEDAGVKKKMQNLINYFEVRQILCEQFDKEKYNAALEKLVKLSKDQSKSEAVKLLKERLENYEDCNMALKKVIKNINEIDKIIVANDEHSTKSKMGRIMSVVSDYIYNYKLDFKEYPYLFDVVIKIINKKQLNVNSDISNLMSLL